MGGEAARGGGRRTHTRARRRRGRRNKFVAGDATPLPTAALLSSLSFYLSFCPCWSLDARGKRKRKRWTHGRFPRLPSPPEKCTLLFHVFAFLRDFLKPPLFFFIVTVESVLSRGSSRALAVVARRSFVYPIPVSFVFCSLSRRGCLWGMCPAHFCHHPLFFLFLSLVG